MATPTLVIVAPNGARRSKTDHPALPMTPAEIAADVAACAEAGAAMVHLHARTTDGRHSLEIADNAAVLDAVRKQVGERVVIQLTTEAVGLYQPAQQMALIRALQPEAASFALSELIPTPAQEQTAAAFFHWVAEQRILAQYILYSAEQLQYYLELRARALLPATHHHLLFVLGRYQKQQQSAPADLDPFLQLIGQCGNTRWAVCAFGRDEQACLLHAAAQGGDVRIGFENNLHTVDGALAASNAAQITRLIGQLTRIGHAPMSAAELRRTLLPD